LSHGISRGERAQIGPMKNFNEGRKVRKVRGQTPLSRSNFYRSCTNTARKNERPCEYLMGRAIPPHQEPGPSTTNGFLLGKGNRKGEQGE